MGTNEIRAAIFFVAFCITLGCAIYFSPDRKSDTQMITEIHEVIVEGK